MKYVLSLAAAVAAMTPSLATAKPVARAKPEIVLVHGAFETASIWKGVEASLRKDGYRVGTVNLPGRPGAPASPAGLNLGVYRQAVLKSVNAARGPVVLVGHSFGGIIISGVADVAPVKVRTLVYVAALLPRDGDSLLSMANTDPGSQVGPHLKIDKDHGLAAIESDARGELFANGADTAVQAAVAQAIVPEPLPPLAEPIHLTGGLAKVDKVYVHTARDHVVSPAAQAAMVAGTPVRKEVTLDTGHTPFITDPSDLVKAIEEAPM